MPLEFLIADLKNLGTDVTVKCRESGDYHLFVPFCFADGDAPKIILKDAADGNYLLTDEGHTLMRLSYHDTNLRNSRQVLLKKILLLHSIEDHDGRLIMSGIASKEVAAAVLTFMHGLLEIVDVARIGKDSG